MNRLPTLAITLALLAPLPALAPSLAWANDSTAELTTGGLVLTRTEHIEMRSEDLFISPEAVRVKYRFLNVSGADIATTVAFPMPDLEAGPDMNIAIPNTTGDNLLNFRTTVDGRPVAARLEQKAILNGRDHSLILRTLGVPLSINNGAPGAAMDRLAEADKQRLIGLGLAEIEEFDAGKGWERHMAPRWTLKSTWSWTQTFPAGREIAVDHAYQPSVGGSVLTALGADWQTPQELAEMRARYCIDDAFMTAVARRQAAAPADSGGNLSEHRIDYVLTTGANWSKPIGDFRLVVDKGKPDNLVSFCADGVKKISPTRFEVRKAGFTPKQDLSILILSPITGQ